MAESAEGIFGPSRPCAFTTNCLMPPKPSYSDRVFTTALVSYPGIVHIDGRKDFSPVIQKALELGGFKEDVTIPESTAAPRSPPDLGGKLSWLLRAPWPRQSDRTSCATFSW